MSRRQMPNVGPILRGMIFVPLSLALALAPASRAEDMHDFRTTVTPSFQSLDTLESLDVDAQVTTLDTIDSGATPDDVTRNSTWDPFFETASASRLQFGVTLLGPSPYSRNNTVRFIPASVNKLYTTGLAVELLGNDFKWETRLEWREVTAGDQSVVTDLKIIGSGDPSLGSTGINRLASSLKAAGVREVRGPIVAQANDPRWNEVRFPPGLDPEDIDDCFATQPLAFNFQKNCATYRITGPGTGSWDKGIEVPVRFAPDASSMRVIPVRTALADNGEYLVKGRATARSVTLHVQDTLPWARNLLTAAARAQGIAIVEARPPTATGAARSASNWSKTLREIIKPMLKDSDNFAAETLYKTVAILKGDRRLPIRDAARALMEQYIARIGTRTARKIGVQEEPGYFSGQVTIVDGAGLSLQNSSTTDAMMAHLRDLSLRNDFAPIWDGLPIAARDGTLKNRMGGTSAAGVLRAKTGTIAGGASLAGYVPRFSAQRAIIEYVPFVILAKATKANRPTARDVQDKVAVKLASLVKAQ